MCRWFNSAPSHRNCGDVFTRSRGLLRFVEASQNLTRLPRPQFAVFPVQELFNHVLELMSAELTTAR